MRHGEGVDYDLREDVDYEIINVREEDLLRKLMPVLSCKVTLENRSEQCSLSQMDTDLAVPKGYY